MKRLFLACSCALALLAIALYLTGSSARDRAIADADRALAGRAQFFADALDRTLQQRMVQVFTFAALPSVRGFAASDETARPARAAIARVELHAIVTADPNVRAASIVDATGTVILTTDDSMLADWSGRIFVQEALAGHLHASVPVREFGEISQFYSAPIINNFGDVSGGLVLRVAVQEMWGVFDAQNNVLLVDENGVRIADRSDKPQTFVALVPLSSDTIARVLVENRYGTEVTQIRATNFVELASAIKRGDAAQLAYQDPSGQTIRAATWRLAMNPWTVIAFEREDAILSPVRDAMADQIKVVVIAVAIAAGLVYVAGFVIRRNEVSH